MTLYMGIDVGKRKHTALVINEHGQRVVKAFTFANDRTGIERVRAQLHARSAPVEVAMEATGHYWLALFA
ncbi:MAG: transposase, partial [Chloroflexota bacterium]